MCVCTRAQACVHTFGSESYIAKVCFKILCCEQTLSGKNMKKVSLFHKQGNKIIKGSSLCSPSEDSQGVVIPLKIDTLLVIDQISLQEAAALDPTLPVSGKLAICWN